MIPDTQDHEEHVSHVLDYMQSTFGVNLDRSLASSVITALKEQGDTEQLNIDPQLVYALFNNLYQEIRKRERFLIPFSYSIGCCNCYECNYSNGCFAH